MVSVSYFGPKFKVFKTLVWLEFVRRKGISFVNLEESSLEPYVPNFPRIYPRRRFSSKNPKIKVVIPVSYEAFIMPWY